MQRGLAPILIILILAGALALAGGAYYLGTKRSKTLLAPFAAPSQTPQPTSSTDETVDWEIYIDEQAGFSFKYSPDDFVFNNKTEQTVVFDSFFNPGNQKVGSVLKVSSPPTIDPSNIKICPDQATDLKDLKECIEKDGSYDLTTKKILGENQVITFSINKNPAGMADSYYVIQILKEPKVEFKHRLYGGGQHELLERIVATVQFLK